jgi:hypothetical protein
MHHHLILWLRLHYHRRGDFLTEVERESVKDLTNVMN